LLTLAIYVFFAGIAAVVIGIRIMNLGLTKQPFLSGVGFILTGLAGICAAPTLYLKINRAIAPIWSRRISSCSFNLGYYWLYRLLESSRKFWKVGSWVNAITKHNCLKFKYFWWK
jgi:hypothetical protein